MVLREYRARGFCIAQWLSSTFHSIVYAVRSRREGSPRQQRQRTDLIYAQRCVGAPLDAPYFSIRPEMSLPYLNTRARIVRTQWMNIIGRVDS